MPDKAVDPTRVPKDPGDRAALFAALRARILIQKEQLNERLAAGKINNVEFASEVNNLVAEAIRDSEGILEPSEFAEMFGIPHGAGVMPVLLDPAISALEDKSQ